MKILCCSLCPIDNACQMEWLNILFFSGFVKSKACGILSPCSLV